MVDNNSISLLGYTVELKWLSLVLLIVQNTFLVLAMRYSRVHPAEDGQLYLTSTAVVVAEFAKLIFSVGMTCFERREQGDAFSHIWSEIYNPDSLKLSVPGILYTVQNNLLFVALSSLEAAVYQITYQIKIMTTALFSVILLGKTLNRNQIFALCLLMVGVALVQLSNSDTKKKDSASNNQVLGLTCVLLACCSSGFAGVYTEKILKQGRPVSLYVRNIQLALFGIIIGLFGVYTKDYTKIQQGGFFQGYNKVVYFVVLLQAGGGLMIAVVMKYADNILKGFATSISIILSSYLSSVFFGFTITGMFLFGATLVIGAVFLYGMKVTVLQRQNSSKV
mmetsp:Transcript_8250/g.13355  ORF Transcript_8250/g.13355 Transcript_8250/m.13355 type:complete len:336 (-) Transcript_8250:45-1052(-)